MSAPSLIGTTLGGYAVQALLGSGGMASVYRGLDPNLQRPVAIKVLGAHAAAMPGFAGRFRQEARLIANLRHPNIVQVYAFGEERGLTYMVQELLPGPTLEQHMADAAQLGRRLQPDKVTRIIAQLATALDAAHAAGVIHRDVKPANALWNSAGALVLTDFGIAKDTVGAVAQTQAGLVMGTPTYMAPEQAQGLPLTPATDVYALGIVLFELLAGRVPFDAPTPLAVALQHIQSPPPSLVGLRPDLPPAVEAVVQRALAKEPQARFANAGALAQALEQAWTAPVGAGSVHQLPTQAWIPSASARATPVATAAPIPRQHPHGGAPAPLAGGGPAGAGRPSLLLPILGTLLLLVFAGGALLALRGNPDTTAQVTPAPTATTAEDATPASPTSAGTFATPTTPASVPVAQVRELLAGAEAGPNGPALLATLDQAQQALDQGDAAGASSRLAELQRTLLADARAGTLAPTLLRKALSGVDAVADEHGLTLPLTVSAN